MKLQRILVCCLIYCLFSQSTFSQDDDNPDCSAVHNIGKLVVKSSVASGFGGLSFPNRLDCLQNKRMFTLGAEYPKNSGVSSLYYGSIIIGGILNNDTLVSGGNFVPISAKKYRSILDPDSPYFEDAVSEQDYISVSIDNYDDTNYFDYVWQGGQKSLNLQITKKSYAWSYDYAEDFVLFDFEIKNIGNQTIKDVYIGVGTYFASGYHNGGINFSVGYDDIVGTIKNDQSPDNCTYVKDDMLMMWGADIDGDPVNGEYTDKLTIVDFEKTKSATSVSGVFFLDELDEKFNRRITKSYNWWDSDFNVQSKAKYRENKDGSIRPVSHGDYYHILSNSEIDYDQIYTASILPSDPVWRYPNQEIAPDISHGKNYYFPFGVLAIGPFNLTPGAVLKVPHAYVAGENFHTDPSNGNNLPDFPGLFYRNLDFSDLTKNAQWARWVYDNPGVDTDGDGDSGMYKICVLDSQLVDGDWATTVADTSWYRGDGIPDWRAAAPPPPPIVWLEPSLNSIRVRFNGTKSETEKDIFTQIPDFEGYNIYFGRDERESSLSLVASFDKENYDKFVYHSEVGYYIVEDIPMTMREIRCAYADSCDDESFDPLVASRVDPFHKPDSLFYFKKHSFNSEYSAITKVYSNARDPRNIHPDSLNEDDYTSDGFFKYFEYEFTIENLLSTVDYWINVTSFDFGSPKSGLKALETPITLNLQPAYPLIHADELSSIRKQVYVYPNPYRIDADYRDTGYEGRIDENRPDFRLREINFANLPPKCEIKIFSLDGDLIKHLSHDKQITDPTHTHEEWNMITRNIQALVSGLYYWTVEFPDGEVQIGKFVVLM